MIIDGLLLDYSSLLTESKMGVGRKKRVATLTSDMHNTAKINDRLDSLFASQRPKHTIFGPLCMYACLVIISRLLMLIWGLLEIAGRKEEEKGQFMV